MSHNTTVIEATPEQIFAILSNPKAYEDWVVGSDVIRSWDPDFPAKGTRFHHRVGTGPIKVRDHTEVANVNPPYRLELIARARPLLGNARVIMLLDPRSATSSYVTMIEVAADLPTKLTLNPLTDPIVHVRNAESLRRLRKLAEAGRAVPTEPATAGAGGR